MLVEVAVLIRAQAAAPRPVSLPSRCPPGPVVGSVAGPEAGQGRGDRVVVRGLGVVVGSSCGPGG
jgi:hypothetical protein